MFQIETHEYDDPLQVPREASCLIIGITESQQKDRDGDVDVTREVSQDDCEQSMALEDQDAEPRASLDPITSFNVLSKGKNVKNSDDLNEVQYNLGRPMSYQNPLA